MHHMYLHYETNFKASAHVVLPLSVDLCQARKWLAYNTTIVNVLWVASRHCFQCTILYKMRKKRSPAAAALVVVATTYIFLYEDACQLGAEDIQGTPLPDQSNRAHAFQRIQQAAILYIQVYASTNYG